MCIRDRYSSSDIAILHSETIRDRSRSSPIERDGEKNIICRKIKERSYVTPAFSNHLSFVYQSGTAGRAIRIGLAHDVSGVWRTSLLYGGDLHEMCIRDRTKGTRGYLLLLSLAGIAMGVVNMGMTTVLMNLVNIAAGNLKQSIGKKDVYKRQGVSDGRYGV